jgi:AbrB family looped-hinge helix DNA binding protein
MEMKLAKLTSKGQLTIPVAIRKKLHLEEGDQVIFLMDGDGVRLANASVWLTEQNVAGKGNMENSEVKGQEETPAKGRRRS